MTTEAADVDPVDPLTSTERRAITGRANVEKRWAKHRDARLAAGLPPTREMEEGRASRFFDDPDEESVWLDELDRLGIAQGGSRTVRRMAAKRLAEAHARDMARSSSTSNSSAPSTGDVSVLLDYWQEEALRWHRRADRDLAMAEAHRQQARDAEAEVAYLVVARDREADK